MEKSCTLNAAHSAAHMPISFDQIHADFPVNRDLVWLNNCGITPTPGPVRDALVAHLNGYAARGILSAVSESDRHTSIRRRLAALLNADEDDLCLVHHTTEGMTFVSHGVQLRAGDRILLLENEYPSNVYPWERWRERGVEIDFVPVGHSPSEFLENFVSRITPVTRLVSFSAVHWCTGMPLPLDEIGRICRARGIQFAIDGAQGVGMVPIDVKAMGLDYMAFSAWKWLLGPLGLGVLYIRRDRLSALAFPFKGTGSVIDDDRYLPYRSELKPSTQRYVLSTPSWNDWVYFDESLRYLEQVGFSRAMSRIHQLAAYLERGLSARGYTLMSSGFPDVPTGIVSAQLNGQDADRAVATLAQQGIIAAARLGRVRLAPHIYNSEDQLDRAVEALAAA